MWVCLVISQPLKKKKNLWKEGFIMTGLFSMKIYERCARNNAHKSYLQLRGYINFRTQFDSLIIDILKEKPTPNDL